MSGYVRIHRALIGHPAFRNDAEAMAFAWMVARAAWKPIRVRYKDRGICLRRGQLAISVRDFAAAMDRDKAWIERLLKRLKSETMVEVAHETGVTVITICNYNQFQGERDGRETPGETLGETPARQTQDTEQGREEDKKEDTPKAPAKRGAASGVRFPVDWVLPPVSTLTPKARACAEKWSRASYETEGEGFALYWREQRTRRADWTGTWCAWIIRKHSAVMRDQKFGNAPTDTSEALTGEALRANRLNLASLYDKMGRTDEAEAIRRECATPANDAMARQVANLVSGIGR